MINGTISGKVPSKSNCYRIVKFGKRAGLAKAPELKFYESRFALQIERPTEAISDEFSLSVDVYYPSRRADLDNSLKIILDCLQSCGAITNDRNCVEINARRYVDKENPRIEFELKAHTNGS